MVTQNLANNKTGASGTVLQGQGVGVASDFSTATYPATTTISQVLYSSSENVVAGLATANNGVLIASNTGVPSMLAAGTINQVLTANTAAPPSWQEKAGYTLQISCSNGDPLVANNYYLINALALTTSTASGLANQRIYIPVAGTINKVYGTFTSTFNNLATSSVTLRLNNTTNYVVANLAETEEVVAFSNTALGVTVAAGDYIEFFYLNNVFFVSTVCRLTITAYVE